MPVAGSTKEMSVTMDLDIAHPAVDLADGHLVDDLIAVFLDESLDAFAPGRELGSNLVVQNHRKPPLRYF